MGLDVMGAWSYGAIFGVFYFTLHIPEEREASSPNHPTSFDPCFYAPFCFDFVAFATGVSGMVFSAGWVRLHTQVDMFQRFE
jgi:hypothetical protein